MFRNISCLIIKLGCIRFLLKLKGLCKNVFGKKINIILSVLSYISGNSDKLAFPIHPRKARPFGETLQKSFIFFNWLFFQCAPCSQARPISCGLHVWLYFRKFNLISGFIRIFYIKWSSLSLYDF